MNIPASESILSWQFWFIMTLCVHVLAGGIALATFWIPLATTKGGKKHITGGIIFIGAVAIAILCGFIITLMRMKDPINPIPPFSHTVFYLFLCLFIITNAWYGLRVFTLNDTTPPFVISIEKFNAIFVAVIGIFTAYVGLVDGKVLYTIFPFIGISLAIRQFLFWQKWPEKDFKKRMFEHMKSMLTCVIGVWTAFCVIAVPRFIGMGQDQDSLILWFGPTLVFLPVIFYWRHRINQEP